MTAGVNNLAIRGPIPVTPIKKVKIATMIIPTVKLPPNIGKGIPCAVAVAQELESHPTKVRIALP